MYQLFLESRGGVLDPDIGKRFRCTPPLQNLFEVALVSLLMSDFSRDAVLTPCARYGGNKLSKDFLLRDSNSKAFVDAVMTVSV